MKNNDNVILNPINQGWEVISYLTKLQLLFFSNLVTFLSLVTNLKLLL